MARDIQTKILTKLLSSKGLRYRDIRPPKTSNDLYNYHLQFLVNKGLVVKNSELYSLTITGKSHVETIHPLDPLGKTSDLFRLNVLLFVFKKQGNQIQILNQTRKRQPYYGDKGILGGTIVPGENIIDAARRKLKEETGLTAEFKLNGCIRKIRQLENDLFSDILYFLCLAHNPFGNLQSDNKFGKNYWVSLDVGITNEKRSTQGGKAVVDYLKSFKSEGLQTTTFFFREEKQNIKRV